MIASDSEEDCYGNIGVKFKNMVNKLKQCDSFNISSDMSDTEVVVIEDSPKIKGKKRRKNSDTTNHESDESFKLDSSEKIKVPKKKRRSKRLSAKTNSLSEISISEELTTSGKRGRGRGKASNRASARRALNESIIYDISTPSPRRTRGRGRGRGRGRNRNNTNIPTYNIGDVEDYPDPSNDQRLFSNKQDVVIIEDELELNEELSVKVYWQSFEHFKFTIRRYQKLHQIFDFFSQKENVSHKHLLFTYNDRIINANDSPDSIGYSIAKYIDGGIINQSITQSNNKQEIVKDGIRIKFQCQNMKKPFETMVQPNETLSLPMIKFAEYIEIPLNKLQFLFDGDLITGKCTAEKLELEGGECIDVKICV